MKRNGWLVLFLLAVIGLGLFSFFRTVTPAGGGGPLADDQIWFWDPVESRAFSAPSSENPPLESPWGNPAPMVVFFGCGSCDDRFPGFFISFTPEKKAELDANPEASGAALGPSYPGRMYSVDAEHWVVADSLEAANAKRNLTGPGSDLATRCPGELQTCR